MSETNETLEELRRVLSPGSTLLCTGGLGEPSALLDLVARNPELSEGLRVILIRPPGSKGTDIVLPGARVTVFFEAPDLVAGENVGQVELIPMQYSQICRFLREVGLDAVWARVAPVSGDDGNFSAGLCADFLPIALDEGAPLFAEVNRAFPAPVGAPRIARERCVAHVSSDAPPPTSRTAPDEVADRIGAHVASLIEDGDCVETGIGAIPGAVLRALGNKNDLGVHSGLISDEVRQLAEAGVVTGARKTIDRGHIVTGFVLGSEELYEWAATDPRVSFRSAAYTHDTSVLGQIDAFKAVNSAVEVDLLGQVNAEMIRGRQVSGTGGALDFVRGAARSRGGRSIVALPATAARGKVSRIVPALAAGTVATTTRTDLDYVVTEFGVARLSGRGVEARARALIEVAAPEFREGLAEAWEAGAESQS